MHTTFSCLFVEDFLLVGNVDAIDVLEVNLFLADDELRELETELVCHLEDPFLVLVLLACFDALNQLAERTDGRSMFF
jgi:hypothetical protein